MTKSEFIKAKLTAKEPQFKELCNLKESNESHILLDFMTMLHPNVSKWVNGSTGEVNGNRYYFFKIYTTCIIRTDVYSGKKTMYKRN